METAKRTGPWAIPAGCNSAAAVSRELAALSDTQLLRLYGLARLRARALPEGVGWYDLLHEALARALDGSRQWPPGVPFIVFIAGVMRSVCHELWSERRREAELIVLGTAADIEGREVASPAANQECVLAASEALAQLYRLFAGDAVALLIIAGLASGLSAADIRAAHNISPRRMRRALLRAGLAWSAS